MKPLPPPPTPLPTKIRLADAYLRLLMARDSLEMWLCACAMVWGTNVYLFNEFLSVAYNRFLVDTFGDGARYIGAYTAVLGFLGLVAVWDNVRWLRILTALALSFFWGLLTIFFFTRIPPISSAVGVYGMLSLAEIWVYVRVSGHYDRPPVP